ncbi:MAG: competence protein CoiA family protein [Ghiorsea sp.]
MVIHHVSDFEDSTVRPKVCCPEYHKQVVMALGKINAHHYRHKSNSNCSLKGNRESIMHSNVKHHIGEGLNKATKIHVIEECSVPVSGCASKRETTIFSGWDATVIECKIDKYYADEVS